MVTNPAFKPRHLVALLRPGQSYKALILWLPAIFHGKGAWLGNAPTLLALTLAWGLASQMVYVFNDLVDLEKDKANPDRCHRPLASGRVSRGQAWALLAALALILSGVLGWLPRAALVPLGAYLAMNVAYSLGLKNLLGVRQALVALGFWLRLQAGGEPAVPIPVTPWAGLFTVGLAYYLNCLKGFGRIPAQDHPARWVAGMGAILAGSLALVALAALCLKRASEGGLAFPEIPPLLCLVGLHRFAHRSFRGEAQVEQARAIFLDPVILATMALFTLSLAWH